MVESHIDGQFYATGVQKIIDSFFEQMIFVNVCGVLFIQFFEIDLFYGVGTAKEVKFEYFCVIFC